MAHRRSSGVKRQVTWVGPADQAFVPVLTGSAIIVSSFEPAAAANNMMRPTIVRTRGSVTMAPVVGIAADVDIVGAYGMCIVSLTAFGVGITSVPTPFDDAGWEGWLVWRSFSIRFESNAALTAHINQLVHEVDSKAMRKVGTDDVVIVVAESQVGAFGISAQMRQLYKLS